ncbi:uncharacterized protein LOC144867497 isoform X2 [Branchiostoma floridae x Branchiostoma japonicum]
MSTQVCQDRLVPSIGAWTLVEYPDKPRNIYLPRHSYQTAINLPVSRHPPPAQQQRFSVREGNVYIHVYDLFVRASDDRGLLFMHFSEDTRFKIIETMVKMFVPDSSLQEDSFPDDTLVYMQPYKDTESGENVTVITTPLFNSMDGLQKVLVAPMDLDGRVDIPRTRACLKNRLTPLDGPEVQTWRAIPDIREFFLQGFSPTAVVTPSPEVRQQMNLQDVQHENTNRTDDPMLEQEGHMSQRRQTQDTSGTADNAAVRQEGPDNQTFHQDMIPVYVLRHFRKTKSTFGTHQKMCRLCREYASPLFHTTICRGGSCRTCMGVTGMIACHMGRCVDPTCPLFMHICANDISISPFVPRRFEPTVLFVGFVRSVLARVLRFDP